MQTFFEHPIVILVIGTVVGFIPTLIISMANNKHNLKMFDIQHGKETQDRIWMKKEEAYTYIMNYLDECRSYFSAGQQNNNEFDARVKEKYLDKFAQFNLYTCKDADILLDEISENLFTMSLKEFEPYKNKLYSIMRRDLGIDK